MTAVRDPAFWRRFSMAVHLDEEHQVGRNPSSSTGSATEKAQSPKLEHTDSWLDRNRKKQQRAFTCGWIIVLVLILMIAGIAMACLWLFKVGPFAKSH